MDKLGSGKTGISTEMAIRLKKAFIQGRCGNLAQDAVYVRFSSGRETLERSRCDG